MIKIVVKECREKGCGKSERKKFNITDRFI